MRRLFFFFVGSTFSQEIVSFDAMHVSKGNSDVLCDYIGMNMIGEQQKFLFYEHIVSFRLLEHTSVGHSEVLCQRRLAVILQCMNGSNGLLLHETICIVVTKFNIDLLQSSIIALLTYGHSSQHFGCHVT